MNQKQIKEELRYHKIIGNNLSTVNVGSEIKYFKITSEGDKVFMRGGKILQKGQYKLRLSKNGHRWWVDRKNCIFYKKYEISNLIKKNKRMKILYEGKINELKKTIISLRRDMHDLRP